MPVRTAMFSHGGSTRLQYRRIEHAEDHRDVGDDQKNRNPEGVLLQFLFIAQAAPGDAKIKQGQSQ